MHLFCVWIFNLHSVKYLRDSSLLTHIYLHHSLQWCLLLLNMYTLYLTEWENVYFLVLSHILGLISLHSMGFYCKLSDVGVSIINDPIQKSSDLCMSDLWSTVRCFVFFLFYLQKDFKLLWLIKYGFKIMFRDKKIKFFMKSSFNSQCAVLNLLSVNDAQYISTGTLCHFLHLSNSCFVHLIALSVCTYMYIYMCIYVCVHVQEHVCRCVCVHVHTSAYTHACTCPSYPWTPIWPIWLGTQEPPASVSWILSSIQVSVKEILHKQCPLYNILPLESLLGVWLFMTLWYSLHNWNMRRKGSIFTSNDWVFWNLKLGRKNFDCGLAPSLWSHKALVRVRFSTLGQGSLFLESPHSYAEQQSPVSLQLSAWPTLLQGGMS